VFGALCERSLITGLARHSYVPAPLWRLRAWLRCQPDRLATLHAGGRGARRPFASRPYGYAAKPADRFVGVDQPSSAMRIAALLDGRQSVRHRSFQLLHGMNVQRGKLVAEHPLRANRMPHRRSWHRVPARLGRALLIRQRAHLPHAKSRAEAHCKTCQRGTRRQTQFLQLVPTQAESDFEQAGF
jgi:hypothetical protein